MASEPSEAPRPLDDRSRSVEPRSQRGPTAAPEKNGIVEPAIGSDQLSRQATDGRDDHPMPADRGEASAITDALVSDGDSFRSRWSSVQVGFVDDPHRAVEEAEQLVADVIADLVEGFRHNRQQLDDDRDATTDEMRMAFQRYRDFFDRLLNA